MPAVTRAQLENAEQDCLTIERVVNDPPTGPDIISRLGRTIRPIAKVVAGVQTKATQAGTQIDGVVAAATARVNGAGLTIFQARDAAVAARIGAQTARDETEGLIGDAVAQGNVPFFSTVGNVRALSPPTALGVIGIHGFYQRDDGLGGRYRWRPDSMVPDDGGAGVIKPDNVAVTAAGRWHRIYERAPFVGPTLSHAREDNGTVGLILPALFADGGMYGFTATRAIVFSADDGLTWGAPIAQEPAGTNGVEKLMKTADGEVLLVGPYSIYKSTGWHSGGNVTWRIVQANSGNSAVFIEYGADGDGTKFIVGEYATQAPPGGWANSTYAWISLDAGETWLPRWNSDAITPGQAAASHVHACCYDRWSGLFFVCEGHGTGVGIYWSADDGLTWNKITKGLVPNPAPTVMCPTDGGIVCGTDSVPNGILIIDRASDPADMSIRLGWEWKNRSADQLAGFAVSSFRDPITGIVYVGFRAEGAEVVYGAARFVLAASDGVGADLVYESPNAPPAGSRSLHQPRITPGRRFSGGIYNEVAGLPGLLRGNVTTGGRSSALLDPGGVLGGRRTNYVGSVAVGPDSQADSKCTSIGARSRAASEENTAVGFNARALGGLSQVFGANALATANSAGATAVGRNATVTGSEALAAGMDSLAGTGATALGRSSQAGEGSVAVGCYSNAQTGYSVAIGISASTPHVNAVAIGSSASVTGAFATVVGQIATASLNSTAYGRFARAIGNQTVAVGMNANSPGSDAVVIGFEASTPSNQTVSIGAYSAASAQYATAVGHGASAPNFEATAIGRGAQAAHDRSVAIGAGSVASGSDQANFGARDLEIEGTLRGLIQRSPDGTRYRLKIANGGAVSAVLA